MGWVGEGHLGAREGVGGCLGGGAQQPAGESWKELEAGGLRSKSLKQALGSVSSECRFELLLNLPKICVS